VISQANTGVAGMKNWDVNGIRMAMKYKMGIKSFKGNPGDCIIDNQNEASNRWNR
jgi:hypothetical protein